MAAAKTSSNTSTKVQRWYLGGLASAGAAACTHPLDLLKVRSIIVSPSTNFLSTSGPPSDSAKGGETAHRYGRHSAAHSGHSSTLQWAHSIFN